MSTLTGQAAEPRRAPAIRVAAALGTETGLARVALGIAALHAADDNFFQPEPGVSAGDHLVGGLVQVAFFLGLAWAYPRMRPGLRGTLAIFVGLFVVIMGVGEAGYYTREDGPSGDDYTGLLAIPAGALLAGVGLVTLWRSRRGGGIARRYVRRAALAVGFALGLFLVLYPLGESYVITHSSRAFVPTPNLGTPFEDVSFETRDGLKLVGWYVPSKNGAAIISFPGRKGSREPARLLASKGYGVLLFDRRGEGESEGDPNLVGWQGHRDITAAIDFLETRPDVEAGRIGGVGLSVGGEMMLEEAAGNDRLKAVVSEGAGIRSVREAVHLDGTEAILASWLFGAVTAGTAVWTSNLPPRSLTELTGEITQPVLFIHADPGQGGETLTDKFYDAAKEPKELWVAPGGHVGSQKAAPAEYERRVVGFFDRALAR